MLPAAPVAGAAAPTAVRSGAARARNCGWENSSAARTAVLPTPTTALVTICAGSPVSSPKVSQDRLSATPSQTAVGARPPVRPCRQESQTWGQTREMLRAAARKPRAAVMVERDPFGRGACRAGPPAGRAVRIGTVVVERNERYRVTEKSHRRRSPVTERDPT